MEDGVGNCIVSHPQKKSRFFLSLAMLDVPLNLFLVASEIQSTLTVPIGDDVIVENDETTTIVLSVNNTDVGIINNTAAVITMLDNDGTLNPKTCKLLKFYT